MKYVLTVVLLSIFLLLRPATPPAVAQEPPLVLAFYYAWFDQNTWSSGQSVDLPAQPYNSTDPAVIERHVAQAQGAGIDALVQSWYGPQVENNQTETNFRTLLDIAAARGFKAAVDLEVTSPFLGSSGAVSQALGTLIATHAQHPAYLRYQGKPVIFFWRQQQYSVETWAGIRSQVDPNHDTVWIAEGTDLAYQSVFDGHHLYNIAWAGSPADQLARWGDRVRSYEAENQVDRLWVATAMPGYNDTNLPRSNAFAVSRQGGDYLRTTWRGAIASQPDMVIITSFNEWLEGTQLEPSASYGNLYLDVTREMVTELRGSPPPEPAPLQVASQPAQDSGAPASEVESQSTPAEVAAAQSQPPDGPYIETAAITNVRSGPDTDFETVGRLDAGQTASVIGRTEAADWWLVEFTPAPEGQGWVSGEVVEFVGEVADVPVVEPETAPVETEATAASEGETEAESEEAVDAASTEEAVIEEPTATATPAESAVIIVPEGGVNVRSGPSLEADLLGRLDEDTEVAVIGTDQTGDWWEIAFEAGPNGRGWVAAIVVELEGDLDSLPVVEATEETADESITPTPTVPRVAGSIEASDAINVRDEPSLDGTVVGALYQGETADVLAVSEDGDWWLVEFVGGPDDQAWVAGEFVEFEGDLATVPIFGLGTPTPTASATPDATITPTPTLLPLEQPTFAPTATSIYDATSAALLAARGTPDPSLLEPGDNDNDSFGWSDLPWGILSLVVIAGFFWYQFVLRRRR